MEVILKVEEIKVATDYAKSVMTVKPYSNIMLVVMVPDDTWVNNEKNEMVFNSDGIKHIIKGLHVSLVIDADRKDF